MKVSISRSGLSNQRWVVGTGGFLSFPGFGFGLLASLIIHFVLMGRYSTSDFLDPQYLGLACGFGSFRTWDEGRGSRVLVGPLAEFWKTTRTHVASLQAEHPRPT